MVWFSGPGWGGLVGSVERCFEFCGRGVVAVAVEPLLVEPVHPAQGGEFELVGVVPAVVCRVRRRIRPCRDRWSWRPSALS